MNIKDKALEKLEALELVRKFSNRKERSLDRKDKDKYMSIEICQVQNMTDRAPEICFLNHQNKIFLQTQINRQNIQFLIDTGATHSVLSENILISMMPNYKKQLKKAKTNVSLRGVTGNDLNILGYYKIVLYIPEIGKLPFLIYVVADTDIKILGMDFMQASQMSLIFVNGSYEIEFPKTLLNYTRTIYNNTSIKIPGNETIHHSFSINNVNGNYTVRLLDRPSGIVMPETLISVNESSTFELVFGNSNPFALEIRPYGIKLLISPCDCLISSTENVENIFHTIQQTKLVNHRHKGDIPSTLKPYYTDPKIAQGDFTGIKVVADEESYLIGTIDADIVKSETEQFDLPESIVTHEIDVPSPVDKAEIALKIKEICSNYDSEVVKYLKPALLRNQDLLCKNSWDIATTKECLDFNFKHQIPKNKKIYPVKPEYKANFFATLQYLLHHNIIARSSTGDNYGSPVFAIPRKSNDPLKSKPVRLLCDMRLPNQAISSSVCASMISCSDILKNIVQDAKYCTVLDLSNCFYSIPYSKNVIDSGYTQFLTEFGSFYWVKAAQGSSILPSFMTQYLLKRIYMDSEKKNSYIPGLSSFYDDLIISDKTSTTLKEHFEKVVDVLDRITACGFSLSFDKSIFAVDMTKTSVEVLGFEISKDRISTTQKRKEGLLNSLVKPRTVKQLQSLNGIINYLKPCLNMNECKLAAELHNFIDKKNLIWNEKGDAILEELKKSIVNNPMTLSVPPRNSVNVLYTDASDSTLGGVLFFMPMSKLSTQKEMVSGFVHDYDKDIISQIDKYDINAKPISEIHVDVMNLILDCYKIYNKIISPSLETIKRLIVKNLVLYMPSFANTFTDICIIKDLITNLENNHFPTHEYSDHILLLTLSRILGRSIILILGSDFNPKQKFIKIGIEEGLSSIVLSLTKNGYQILALMQKLDEVEPFDNTNVDNLSAHEILQAFKKAFKQGNFGYGGCFSKKISPALVNSPIHVKELASLTKCLAYFSDYVKMSSTIAVVDNSVVLHNLKAYKQRENAKLFRLGLLLTTEYPLLQLCLVGTSQQKADVFTRLSNSADINCGNPLENCKFSNVSQLMLEYEKLIETANIEEDCQSGQDQISQDDILLEEGEINLVSPLTITYGFENLLSQEKLIAANQSDHSNKLSDKEYENRAGILYKDNKLVIPPSLYLIFILRTHVMELHPGVNKLFEIMNSVYSIENKKEFKTLIADLIGSCLLCQSGKANFGKRYEWHSKYGQKMNYSMSCDVIEFKKMKYKGKFTIQGLLLCIDNVSKFVSIGFLESINTTNIINALLTIFSTQKIPRVMLLDNASYFSHAKFNQFLELFNIKKVQSAPYHSASRGIVERHIGKFREFSRIFCSKFPDIRPELSYIFAARAHNHNKLTGIPASPSFLNFATESTYIQKGDFRTSIIDEWDSRIVLGNKKKEEKLMLDALELYKKSIATKKELDEKRLKSNNQNKHPSKIKEGDIVLVKSHDRIAKHKTVYLMHPSIVLELRGTLAICESLLTGVIRNRHISHIKRLGKLEDSQFPADILRKNYLYSDKVHEMLKEEILMEKQSEKRVTRSAQKDAVDDGLDNDSEDDEHQVFFKLT